MLGWFRGSETVDSLLGKKLYAKAATLARKQLEENPRDQWLRMRLAEALCFNGETDEGIQILGELVDKYVKSGFLVKGIALLKKMQKLAPGRPDIETKLDTLVASREEQSQVEYRRRKSRRSGTLTLHDLEKKIQAQESGRARSKRKKRRRKADSRRARSLSEAASSAPPAVEEPAAPVEVTEAPIPAAAEEVATPKVQVQEPAAPVEATEAPIPAAAEEEATPAVQEEEASQVEILFSADLATALEEDQEEQEGELSEEESLEIAAMAEELVITAPSTSEGEGDSGVAVTSVASAAASLLGGRATPAAGGRGNQL